MRSYKYDNLPAALDGVLADDSDKTGRQHAEVLRDALAGTPFAEIGASLPGVKEAQAEGRGRGAVALALQRVAGVLRDRA